MECQLKNTLLSGSETEGLPPPLIAYICLALCSLKQAQDFAQLKKGRKGGKITSVPGQIRAGQLDLSDASH